MNRGVYINFRNDNVILVYITTFQDRLASFFSLFGRNWNTTFLSLKFYRFKIELLCFLRRRRMLLFVILIIIVIKNIRELWYILKWFIRSENTRPFVYISFVSIYWILTQFLLFVHFYVLYILVKFYVNFEWLLFDYLILMIWITLFKRKSNNFSL